MMYYHDLLTDAATHLTQEYEGHPLVPRVVGYSIHANIVWPYSLVWHIHSNLKSEIKMYVLSKI